VKGEQRATIHGRRPRRTQSAAQVKREAEDARARRRWREAQEDLEAALEAEADLEAELRGLDLRCERVRIRH
jgi:hypothetical protein